MKQFLIALAATVIFTACDNQKTKPNKAQIMKLTKAANDASLQGHIEKNSEKIAAVYTNDAIVLPPGGLKPIIGIDSIKAYYSKQMQGTGRSTDIQTSDIRYDVIDEFNTTQVGNYNIKYKNSDTSSVVEFKGEMLIVWKKINNQWKIYLDMWH
jgi:ketosteroid isomerase-like protein